MILLEIFLDMAERGEIPASVMSPDRTICQHVYLPESYYSYLGMHWPQHCLDVIFLQLMQCMW